MQEGAQTMANTSPQPTTGFVVCYQRVAVSSPWGGEDPLPEDQRPAPKTYGPLPTREAADREAAAWNDSGLFDAVVLPAEDSDPS